MKTLLRLVPLAFATLVCAGAIETAITGPPVLIECQNVTFGLPPYTLNYSFPYSWEWPGIGNATYNFTITPLNGGPSVVFRNPVRGSNISWQVNYPAGTILQAKTDWDLIEEQTTVPLLGQSINWLVQPSGNSSHLTCIPDAHNFTQSSPLELILPSNFTQCGLSTIGWKVVAGATAHGAAKQCSVETISNYGTLVGKETTFSVSKVNTTVPTALAVTAGDSFFYHVTCSEACAAYNCYETSEVSSQTFLVEPGTSSAWLVLCPSLPESHALMKTGVQNTAWAKESQWANMSIPIVAAVTLALSYFLLPFFWCAQSISRRFLRKFSALDQSTPWDPEEPSATLQDAVPKLQFSDVPDNKRLNGAPGALRSKIITVASLFFVLSGVGCFVIVGLSLHWNSDTNARMEAHFHPIDSNFAFLKAFIPYFLTGHGVACSLWITAFSTAVWRVKPFTKMYFGEFGSSGRLALRARATPSSTTKVGVAIGACTMIANFAFANQASLIRFLPAVADVPGSQGYLIDGASTFYAGLLGVLYLLYGTIYPLLMSQDYLERGRNGITGLQWTPDTLADQLALFRPSFHTLKSFRRTDLSNPSPPIFDLASVFELWGPSQMSHVAHSQGAIWRNINKRRYRLGYWCKDAEDPKSRYHGIEEDPRFAPPTVQEDPVGLKDQLSRDRFLRVEFPLQLLPLVFTFALVATPFLLGTIAIKDQKLDGAWILPTPHYRYARFLAQAVLNALAGLVVAHVTRIDMAYRRLQPYVGLLSPRPAKDNLLLSYPTDFVLSIPYSALKRGHWRVAFCSTASLAAKILPIVVGGLLDADANETGEKTRIFFASHRAFYFVYYTLPFFAIYLIASLPPRTRRLPKVPFDLATLLSFTYASKLMTSSAGSHLDLIGPDGLEISRETFIRRLAEDSTTKYAFGVYKGTDDRLHLGFDIQSDSDSDEQSPPHVYIVSPSRQRNVAEDPTSEGARLLPDNLEGDLASTSSQSTYSQSLSDFTRRRTFLRGSIYRRGSDTVPRVELSAVSENFELACLTDLAERALLSHDDHDDHESS
ncbi:hypothetical protein P7C70_g432, partial [Phenoliferia sp. Uapishka_3]